MRESGLLIDGKWEGRTGRFTVLDKFTRSPVADVARAGARDVERAVSGAVRTAGTPLAPQERSALLEAAAALLVQRSETVVDTYVAETGFTRRDAEGELARAAGIFRLCAAEALRIAGEELPLSATPGSENRLGFTFRVPVGVVGAISPFNAPLSTVAHKVGPAIAAGNAVVLKPAEQTPLCATLIAEALQDSGAPPGLLQVLHGDGATGAALVEDRRIGFFTFTGSTAVGRHIKASCGLARTHLELGSNSASLVADDADLGLVADLTARAGYRKAGQVCTSVQRLLVERRVADELAERLIVRAEALVAGDPRAAATDIGPVISEEAAVRTEEWVREAAAGGRTRAGGERDRTLVTPAVVIDPAPGCRLLEDEVFGPVVTLVPVDSFDEAIRTVNEGRYGLQAGVFTQDVDRAFAAARALRVGGVIINDTSSYHADSMPYGGVKDSGHGVEGPRYAVHDMTDSRTVVLNLRPQAPAATTTTRGVEGP